MIFMPPTSILEQRRPIADQLLEPLDELIDGKDLRGRHSSRKGDHPRLLDDLEKLPHRRGTRLSGRGAEKFLPIITHFDS